MRETFPVNLGDDASEERRQLRLGWNAGLDPPPDEADEPMREAFPVDLGDDASEEQRQLRLGWDAGIDPPPAEDGIGDRSLGNADANATRVAVTSSASRWNFRVCKQCGHTFRRRDRVQIGPTGIFHLAPGLFCADADADAGSPMPAETVLNGPEETAELSAGIEAAWPAKVKVRQLRPDDRRIAIRHGDVRPTCLVCGHTFRVGEFVVVCPCQPDSPRCGGTVHRDPAAGLTCWENWRPSGEVKICPVMHRPRYEMSDE
jgi:hypothetical protein